jgi:hypothetical protein
LSRPISAAAAGSQFRSPRSSRVLSTEDMRLQYETAAESRRLIEEDPTAREFVRHNKDASWRDSPQTEKGPKYQSTCFQKGEVKRPKNCWDKYGPRCCYRTEVCLHMTMKCIGACCTWSWERCKDLADLLKKQYPKNCGCCPARKEKVPQNQYGPVGHNNNPQPFAGAVPNAGTPMSTGHDSTPYRSHSVHMDRV